MELTNETQQRFLAKNELCRLFGKGISKDVNSPKVDSLFPRGENSFFLQTLSMTTIGRI